MSGIYGFWQGPTYRASTREELFSAALDQPMSAGATFWDQAKGGVLESFGLGSAIRDAKTPDGAPLAAGRYERPDEFQARREAFAAENKVLDEEAYKTSPYFRDEVPWDASMTEDKAAALATMNDAKRVREYFKEKRPFISFLGNLTGQALDPINYIPVAGPSVRAAAVARMGVVKGIAATAALDAAANTAIAGLATRETRRGYGDDVSWQAMVSEIATAALLGTAFGTVGGVLQRRAGLRADALRSEAEVKVQTLRATQEARIALNEAIGGLANDGEVRLSPNATSPLERIAAEASVKIDPETGIYRTKTAPPLSSFEAYHGTMADFERFDPAFLGKETEVESAKKAFFFSSDPRVSEGYAIDDPYTTGIAGRLPKKIALVNKRVNEALFKFFTGEGLVKRGQVIRTQLRIENPKIVDRKGSYVIDSELEAEINAAKAEGHDAVIFRNSRDPGYTDKSDMPSDVYAVFDADKIDIVSRYKTADEARAATVTREPTAIDASPARPEPIPEGRAEAEAKVAKPENYKALADQYRVDPETGAFPEDAEIRQLKQEGRLSDEDAAVLDDADAAYQDGAAYGEALKSVANCLI